MLDKALVAHGAPTLARMKIGNLFNVACPDREALCAEMRALRPVLREKGVHLTILREKDGRVLLYLYRRQDLAAALNRPEIQAFMAQYGYADLRPEAAIARLRGRIRQSEEFPHEIGVFLGYPLCDIQGFICNEGRNCLCCGCWKVYANPDQAQQLFARYKKCTEAYVRLFASGYPLSRLTVRARTA